VALSDLNRGRLLKERVTINSMLSQAFFQHLSSLSALFFDRVEKDFSLWTLQHGDNRGRKHYCPFTIASSKGKWRSPEEHQPGTPLTEKVRRFDLYMYVRKERRTVPYINL
jgi:hypothetical protein